MFILIPISTSSYYIIFHFYPNIRLHLQFFVLFALTELFSMASKDNPYLTVVWNIKDKQLVKKIFTILKENSTIQKDI